MTTNIQTPDQPAPAGPTARERAHDAEIDELLRADGGPGYPIIPEPDVAARPSRGPVVAGMILIGVGAVLLLGQVAALPGSAFLGALALAFVAARLVTGRYGFAVPAGVLLGIASFVLLTERSPERGTGVEAGGWFFVLLAAGFVAVYAIGARARALWPLFPAAALGAFGLVLLGAMDASSLLPYAWTGAYWPAVLLLVGAWLLVRERVTPAARRPIAVAGTILIILYGGLALGAAAASGAPRSAFAPGLHGIRVGDPAAVRGSGVVVSQARAVSGFSGVALEGAGDVTIRQGSSETLTVEAEDNLQPLLASEVRGGTLVLSAQRAIWPTRPIRYAITVRRLEQLRMTGGGAVTATGIDVDRLRVELDGGGALTLSGSALAQDVMLSGAGRYDASGLATREASVTLNGAGYVLVHAADRLRAAINGVGVVEYVGDPRIERSINGLGTVRRRA